MPFPFYEEMLTPRLASLPIPAVIGIVFGCTIFLLVGILVAFLCVKRMKRKRRIREEGEAAGESTMGYRGAKRGETIEFNPNAY